MKQTLVFRKLSPELEEVLIEELHTLKGGNGGNSENWLNEVEIIGEAPKEEEEEEEEEEEDPEPNEEPDPWEDPDGWWWRDGEDPEEEQQDTSDCKLQYANMPSSGNAQVLSTCAPSVLSSLNNMLGNTSSLDSVINEFASSKANGATSGEDFSAAKVDILANGVSPEDLNNYMQNHYSYNNIDVDYESAQTSIQAGKPIFADLFIGKEDDTYIFHAILITGVGKDGSIKYFDPQLGTYKSTKDSSYIVNGKAIDMVGMESKVKCKD